MIYFRKFILVCLIVNIVAQNWQEICPGEHLQLSCNIAHHVLLITGVEMLPGCQNIPLPRITKCSKIDDILQDIRRSCEGNMDCSLNSITWGFNCPDSNHLRVNYTCQACEDKPVDVSTNCAEVLHSEKCFENRDLFTECLQSCTQCKQDGTRYTRAICESIEESIECIQPPGALNSRVLDVQFAEYGRRNNYTCPHNALADWNCVSESPLQNIKRVCDGRRSCFVASDTNIVYGKDPCPGTYKYLNLRYQCRECKNDHVNVSECEEWERLGLCSSQETMMYSICFATCTRCGHNECRYDDVNCDYWAISGYCSSDIDREFMESTCATSCGTCPNTTIEFNHLDTAIKKQTVCDGSSLILSCPSSINNRNYIHIKQCFYGRKDDYTCSRVGNKYDVKTTNCSSNTSMQVVSSICEGFSTCEIHVDSSLFDAFCPETHKYLEVLYECLAHKNCSENQWYEKGQCICKTHYFGDNCQEFTCQINIPEHSFCVDPYHFICDEGYEGTQCKPLCLARNNCSANGICIGVNSCSCDGLYTGNDCNQCKQTNLLLENNCLPCMKCKNGKCKSVQENLKFNGCYQINDDLVNFKIMNEQYLNIPECINLCNSLVFKFAGISNGGICRCSNSIKNLAISTSCDINCKNDAFRKCGGNNSISTWRASAGMCECNTNYAGISCEMCTSGFTGPMCDVQIGNSTSNDYSSIELSFSIDIDWKHIYLDMDNILTKDLAYQITNSLNMIHNLQFIGNSNYKGIIVRYLRKVNKDVFIDYSILLKGNVNTSFINDIKCITIEYAKQHEPLILESKLAFSNDIVLMCQIRDEFCNGKGEIIFNPNEITCKCPSNLSGTHCEHYSVDIRILISIASPICCIIAVLIAMAIYYFIFKKKVLSKHAKQQITIRNETYSEMD